MLVFRTTQNNPLKIHIGSDTIEISMPDGFIVCELQRGGLKTKLVFEFAEKEVFIRLQRQKNHVAAYIRADRNIKILRDKHVNPASDKSLST